MPLPKNDTLLNRNDESNGGCFSKQSIRCAVLTGAGRAAIAVVALWGEGSRQILSLYFRPAHERSFARGQVRYGIWSDRVAPSDATHSHDSQESVVVVPISDDGFEIHCHGGSAAVRRILDDLCRAGATEGDRAPDFLAAQPPSAVTRRTIEDPLVAAAKECLSRCVTAQTAARVLDQIRGALSRWRDGAIDSLVNDPDTATTIARQASDMDRAGRVSARLTEPFSVVLAGPPNVGKSSLINAMVGYDRSITTEIAGTTRDVLDTETVYDGWPLRLRDTAGLHVSEHVIERIGVERAIEAVGQADLILRVSEPNTDRAHGPSDHLIDRVAGDVPQLNVLNKADLVTDVPQGSIATSATTGTGVDALLTAVVETFRSQLPPNGSPLPINRSQREWLATIAASIKSPKQMLHLLQTGPS